MTSSRCIFCLDEQRSPRRISCGHSFCKECIERYLQLCQDTRCPLCRRDFRHDLQATAAGHSIRLSVTSASSAPSSLSAPFVPYSEAETDSGDNGLQTDTLVLTLSEQECRFFEQLYREISHIEF